MCTSFSLCADTRGLGRNTDSDHSTAFANGKYRAIVIGNNRYRDPSGLWKPLTTAERDAQAVADLLRAKYSFASIDLLKNASRRDILQALSRLRKNVSAEDSVLVYYAGHGWRNEKTREAFWVPVDAEGNDDSTFVSNARIKEKLAVIAEVANHTLLISDSCFSGSLLSASRGAAIPYDPNNESYFRKIARRKSVQIMAAGGSEYVDDNYRGSGHSPFTYFLLKELQDNNSPYLTFNSLALDVEQLVARNADQTPQSGALRKAGDEGGQFIFKLKGVADPGGGIRDRSVGTRKLFESVRPRNNSDANDSGDDRSMVAPLPSF